ncbi:L-dopachrome tautomerase-related protein [Herbaspirillum sp. GCM10030257]|uniref:L-dopachrome tautomerase-related protein n=1 Tax=Herbaspirillum sp. GCM10030257 TaxID=3273393 RepID=UPI003612163A
MYKSIVKYVSIATLIVCGSVQAEAGTSGASLERWRTYEGVSWERASDSNSPSRYAQSVTAPIAGLHFSKDGTAYVSTPRLLSPSAPATISILDLNATAGPARLTAFPSVDVNAVDGDVKTSLRNVLGFHVDHRNNWLWALDMGFIAGESEAPAGAQKLIVFNLKSGTLVKSFPLDSVADRRGSFLNDVAVDEVRQVAYISDSGFRSAPENMSGIIVVNFKTSEVRRVLHQHQSVQIKRDAKVYSHGEEVWPNKPLQVAINGIALSPDAETLYWTVTAGDQLHAMSTAVLRNFKSTDNQVASSVRNLGTIDGNTDGIVVDPSGRVFITNVTHNGISVFNPKRKRSTLLASDERIYWPDTITSGPQNALYFTASNLNNHFAGAVKAGEERYEIWRLPARDRSLRK